MDKYGISLIMMAILIPSILVWWLVFLKLAGKVTGVKRIFYGLFNVMVIYFIFFQLSSWTWWTNCVNADVKGTYCDIVFEETRKMNLITNIRRLVNKYGNYEKEIVSYTSSANGDLLHGRTDDKKFKFAGRVPKLNKDSLIAVGEKYPTLKADISYLRLMDELIECENRIAGMKHRYNEFVALQNCRITTFPYSVYNYIYYENMLRYVTIQDNLIEKMDYNNPDTFYNW